MFNLTRWTWNGMIKGVREEKWDAPRLVTLCCLIFIIFISIPFDIIVLPLDIIIYIAIKTDKNKKKRK